MKTQNTITLNKKTVFVFKSVKNQNANFGTTGCATLDPVTAETVLMTMGNIF